MTHSWRRWVPAVAVPAVIAAAVLAGGIQSASAGQLAPKSPHELIALLAGNSVRQFSGTLQQSSHLGLPELPASAPTAATGALEFLTGSHTVRIYADGPQRLRVQLLDQLAERDLVRNGSDVWGYNSKDNSATHWTLPAAAAGSPAPAPSSALPEPSATPQDLAQTFLDAITPTTKVSVGPQTQVAGRDAYQLVLEPQSSQTLVGSVSIDVDAATGMPLGVDVMARGQQDAAVSVAFSTLDLSAPAASLFTFSPPAGASVAQGTVPPPPAHMVRPGPMIPGPAAPGPTAPGTAGPTPGPGIPGHGVKAPLSVSGTGWDAVVELPAGASAALLDSPLLAQATTPVAGGRLLSTALVNVYLANDGRIFAGSVPFDRLQAAAAAK
jgi:outer membrane lipoprotein-sorting protein